MKIGILSFYREINFGATLQALSTYKYLEKAGHFPVFINYYSEKKDKKYTPLFDLNPQTACFASFVDKVIKNQTVICHNANEINKQVSVWGIEAIIVGSDAVLQHHLLQDRIKFNPRRLLDVVPKLPDTTFPNPFWGVGIKDSIKMALMSVSSQNSEYTHFSEKVRSRMKSALKRFTYYSVRDEWTKDMLNYITDGRISNQIRITPDPVFNFNNNAGELIPTKLYVEEKFSLPSRYVLISLHGQSLSFAQLKALKDGFASRGIHCVALPTQFGINFVHPFEFEIMTPLNPLDWYALIKYSNGYIGNNMHPIVVALHNAVPCFSIDIWGTTNFWGKKKDDGSSKVYHIMNAFGVSKNIAKVENNKCQIMPETIIDGILNFPIMAVKEKSQKLTLSYYDMMNSILKSLCVQ